LLPLSPDEKQADVARHPAGKVHNSGRKMETVRLQIVAPSEINFRRLAAQRRRPIGVRHIDGAAAIAAQLAWEAQELEFLPPLLRRGARSVNEIAPAFL
jgi:hypothetical protein